MPADLQKQLKAQDLVDIVEYLTTLKKAELSMATMNSHTEAQRRRETQLLDALRLRASV